MADGDILLNVNNNIYDISIIDGDIGLCESYIESVEQAGYVAIMTRLGDNIFHDELGNDLWNQRIKICQSNNDIITEYCKDAVMSSDEAILNIDTLDIYINNDYANNISAVLRINESDIDTEDNDDDNDEEDGEEYVIAE